jgi:hypothetical protein
LVGFRHNPYVGSFHRVNYIPFSSENFYQNIINDVSKRNPIVGLIRHSPSTVKSSGLKRIIDDDSEKAHAPLISRINVVKEISKTLPHQNFVASLKTIPHSKFSTSASSVPESVDPDSPMCTICREVYSDGDNILTLACSHCFHSECLSKWFYQDCLDSSDMSSSFRCPHCRQNHVSINDGSICSEDLRIPVVSFEQIGQSLLEDGGYDLLNDVLLEEKAVTPKTESSKVFEFGLNRSCYSDCGVPLIAHQPNTFDH